MKQLRFNLHREFFDMILSGDKKEEYRDITPFYISQLFNWRESGYNRTECVDELMMWGNNSSFWKYLKDFEVEDTIIFDNGYQKNRPSFEIGFDSIGIGTGKTEWGAEPEKLYFVFYLGDVK